MGRGDAVDCGHHAIDERFRIDPDHVPLLIGHRLPERVAQGPQLFDGDVRIGVPVPLGQVVVDPDTKAGGARQWFGRLVGPTQRARVDGVDPLGGEPCSESLGLDPSGVVEARVDGATVAYLASWEGVADEEQLHAGSAYGDPAGTIGRSGGRVLRSITSVSVRGETQRSSSPAIVGGIALVVLATAIVGWRYLFRFPLEPMVDLNVYKQAGSDLLHGRPIYGASGDRLVFTYPPFAAFVAVLVAPMGWWLGNMVWATGIALATTYVVAVSFRAALDRVDRRLRFLVLGAVTAFMILTHPLVENIFYGQINVFLIALVLADMATPSPRWPRGLFVGIATAIKLTPGVFGLHLWLTERRRAAVTALVTFLVCTAVAAAFAPGSSRTFWTTELFATDRIGAPGYTSNQSLYGMASRLLPGGWVRPSWLLAALVVAIVGFRRARTAHLEGDEMTGIAIVGLLAVLLSPIAWIHHFAWMIVALGALVGDMRDRRRVVLAVLIGSVLLLRLPWWGWSMLDHGMVVRSIGLAFHNAYCLIALGLVLFMPIGRLRE